MDSNHEGHELIDSVAHELRRPVAVGGADFTARLMAEIEREPRRAAAGASPALHAARVRRATAPARALEWLSRPRTIRISPLAGLAAAAGIAALAVLATPRAERIVRVPVADSGVEVVAASAAESREPRAESSLADSVDFVLHAPDAKSVAVAGDFNDWNPAVTPLLPREGGLWVARVPLPAGRYEYTFVVDGASWMPDPAAPQAPAGDYGATNSVLIVGGTR